MIYGCMKNEKCVNVIVLGETAAELIPLIMDEQNLDEIVPLPEGYGVGDACDGGVWTYGERPQPPIRNALEQGAQPPVAGSSRLEEVFSALTQLTARVDGLASSFGELREEVASELAKERKGQEISP